MNAQIRKYPIGTQDFKNLREGGFVYVDKTAFIYKLLNDSRQYFLSRPRRFGKSLFISTLKYYFLGRKELFEGLSISEVEKEWAEYPVLHIDFTGEKYSEENRTLKKLDFCLRNYEEIYGKNPDDTSVGERFIRVIKNACQKTGQKVVVLVDEYDKPLLETLDNIELHEQSKADLKSFYGVLKGMDEYLRFVFLTGVTKFSKVSIFSDLNQLNDISMEEQYAEICGISETELKANFQPDIETLAAKNEMSVEEAIAELKFRYDGYHFSKQTEGMYNPFSLLNCLSKKDFGNYWFATGTPTFLVKMLKDIHFDISNLEENTKIDAYSIMDYRYENRNPVPVMYQSGYLTIKSYDKERNQYILGYPNEEVKYGFLKELLPIYNTRYDTHTEIDYNNFVDDLLDGQVDTFMERLQVFFLGFPYDLENKTEKYYQTIFYILFALMGQRISAEPHYAVGRPDAIVEFKDKVYIFEFKLDGNGTAEDALKQIDTKDYAGKYQLSGKEIIKIGAVFDNEKRNIKEWKAVNAK